MGNKSFSSFSHSPVTICPNCASRIPLIYLYVINSKAYVDLICECSEQIQSMSLSSYLTFIKTATITKPQINFYCKEHHSKFVEYCESCSKNICKHCKHRRHRKMNYKEKSDSIDIKEIKEKSEEIKLRIIQSNQIIKFDFEDMINMKYKELKKYLTAIDQCYYDNLTTNSEMVDLVNVVINTYELCIKNDIYNRNIFYNLKQITKINVKLLDATEENYEIRIQTLLRYYKTFFMLIHFNTSINYKISKIYTSNKRMTDLTVLKENIIAIVFNDNTVKIFDISRKETVKEIDEKRTSKENEYNMIFKVNDDCFGFGGYKDTLFIYTVNDYTFISDNNFNDLNVNSIVTNVNKDYKISNKEYRLNTDKSYVKISSIKWLTFENSSDLTLYSSNSIVYTNHYKDFELLCFAVDDNSNLLIATSNNNLLILNTETFTITSTLTIPFIDYAPLTISLMKDNRVLVSKKNKVIMYDMKMNDIIHSFDIKEVKAKAMTVMEDGRVLLSSKDDIELMDNIIYYN